MTMYNVCTCQINVLFCIRVLETLTEFKWNHQHHVGINKVTRNFLIRVFLWILWLKQVGFLDNTPIFITKLQKCGFYSARECSLASIFHSRVTFIFTNLAAQQIYTVGSRKLRSVFIATEFNGSINKIKVKLGKPTLFIQDGGYLFTN